MIKLFVFSLANNKRNILIATIVFFLSVFLGYLIDPKNDFVRQLMSQLANIAEQIKNYDNVLFTIYKIFINNLFAAVKMILLGAILGIIPLISLFSNGILIGVFLKIVTVESNQSISYFLIGILPHGILEIPAIIIAAAFGMKLGFTLIRAIIWAFSRSIPGEKSKALLIATVKQTAVVSLGITITLFFAAIIESTLTVYLLSMLQ